MFFASARRPFPVQQRWQAGLHLDGMHTQVSGSRRVARVQRTHTHERLVSSTWRALRLTLWQLGFSGAGFERRKCYFIFPLQKPRGVQIVATSCFRNAYANSLALLLLFSLSLSLRVSLFSIPLSLPIGNKYRCAATSGHPPTRSSENVGCVCVCP